METVSSNADKSRSYSTLNTLYHETRQEMELLNKQMVLKDNIISELKTRLTRFERTRVMVGDNESVVVGPSKSLLESLCKEICKLKQKNNDAELKASKLAAEIQRLNSQLRAKDAELERIQHQPDHEKDREIQQLRSALEERERRDATQAVLYSSLAEEADQLRGQLAATVKVCQELLARLEKEKTAAGGGGVEQQGKAFTESSERSDVNLQISQLEEENRQLKQRVAYVQGLNTQWQKYDSSREDYIQGLCQRLRETASQGMVPGLGGVSAGLLRHEISRLNGLLEEKVVECERLEREMEDDRRQDRERIQTLEQQVLIYTEDFKSERADRERAQSQIQELKEKIHQLKQHVHKQQAAASENREAAPVCRVHIGHRISSRRHRESAERMLKTKCEMQQQLPAAASQNLARSVDVGLSELQCPRCLAIFSDTDAAEYLNHCEECAKL
ncbi:TNFAIP3-interacting protein 2 isoform X1 [Synchiropus splendidus]|uniref:TNFAIP3-interacting protein 2 isoform X1 n=1 Tax=Synchiropus splendidus TaxID=270530 RepID=UPI00237D5E22|nr:TNFAIP3-interacting protein 2 isoform X1 [Synchiropus splendidus]